MTSNREDSPIDKTINRQDAVRLSRGTPEWKSERMKNRREKAVAGVGYRLMTSGGFCSVEKINDFQRVLSVIGMQKWGWSHKLLQW